MNHKRDAAGFAPLIVVLILVIVLSVAGACYYVYSHTNGKTFDNPLKSQTQQQEFIDVKFKDGTTFNQADALVKKYHLEYNPSGQESGTNFTPWYGLSINKDHLDELAIAVKKYPEVTSFGLNDPIFHCERGADQVCAKIMFNESASYLDILNISNAVGLGLTSDEVNGVIWREITVTSNDGKGKYYASQFKKSPQVVSANSYIPRAL